jgi:hypothetical protein
MVSLVGLFADPERVTRVLTDTVAQLGPSTAANTFKGPIESITSNRGAAGVLFVVGVIAALWSASGYVSAFADASNTIYAVRGDRRNHDHLLRPLAARLTPFPRLDSRLESTKDQETLDVRRMVRHDAQTGRDRHRGRADHLAQERR